MPIKLSHSETPYQRCSLGMVKTNLKAKVTFSGIMSKAVTSSQPLFITCCPSEDIETSLSTSRTNQSAAEGLGIVLTHVRSENFSVGGYCRFALSLPSPSPTLKLHKLELTLIQCVKLTSRANASKTHTADPTRMIFLTVAEEELYQRQAITRRHECEGFLEQHEKLSSSKQGYENDWVARFPNDNFAR